MIPRETVNRILDATRIEDVVSEVVTLKRRGANLIACCPFHNEKTPSFIVSPAKGIYKCFGCGKSGTAVGFVMEHQSLGYADALKYLAKKYNIEVVEKEESAEELAQRKRGESLLLVSEFAGKFFADQLKTPEGRVGYAYFKSRGLEDETIEKFGLGWAPKGRNTLQNAARAAGFKEEYLVDTGLCFRTDDGRILDRFYDRVAFPIHNVNGHIIAFGCRTLLSDKSVAKYVNSPETEIYHKRETLYGMYQAKTEVHRQDKFILVEGYLDVISMHQLGICNVAASSGTSLTTEQVRLIKRFTENVTIIYDGDSAGIHAALRGIGLVLEGGLNVKVVLLPDGDDPDSFSRKHTRAEVEEFIAANEQDFIEFKMRIMLQDAGNDPIKRALLINDIADTIALIPDAVKRSVYVQFAAAELRIDEALLFDRIKKSRNKRREELRREQQREEDRRFRESHPADAAAGYSPAPDGGYEPAPWPTEEPPYDGEMPSGESFGGPVSAGPSYEGVALVTDPLINDRDLAPSERDLLRFMLRNGRDGLEFDQDSPYYHPTEVFTVAEFIDGILSEDKVVFANAAYRKTYDAYLELYDQQLTQAQITVRLLQSEDPQIREVVSSLIEDRHQITVAEFEASLTKESTLLTAFVPKAILVYHKARIDRELKELNRDLAEADDQEEILRRIMELTKNKNKLTTKLGRV